MEHFLQEGAANPWLFIPTAIILGALHGLEPGHSKTMMAAFIVAIRGSVRQAVLLGLSATFSHTLVVWAVALAGLHFGRQWSEETSLPYFNLASSVVIIIVALWMILRTRAGNSACAHKHDHHHHDHGHHHHGHHDHGHDHHGEHSHEEHPHPAPSPLVAITEEMDAHEREHANDIRKKFEGRDVTTGQIIVFGLTGGLIPCPAAITVLLLCLQVKRMVLGAALVLSFSAGLALTLVLAGVAAALGAKHLSRRWDGFDTLARRAPYISGALILTIGLYIGIHALIQLYG